MLFVIFGAMTSYALWHLNQGNLRGDKQRKTQEVLQQAKEALIGDAVASSTPGRLRCPEKLSLTAPIEGQAQSSCATPSSRIGRFPWRTLRLERLADGDGEPLWYALSPGFSTAPINHAVSVGQIQLNAQPNAAVAIIIAPGVQLAGQIRGPVSPSTPPLEVNYLDLGNAGGTNFISTGPAASFNDHIIVITHADLFKAINARVLAEIRGLDDQAPNLPIRGLRNYYNTYGTFPWADSNNDGDEDSGIASARLPYNELSLDAWLSANQWLPLVSYVRTSSSAAEIGIGTSVLKVTPCPALPCN